MDSTPIFSKTNNLVKRIKKLADKKYRAEFGEYVAEGMRWVTDAMRICPDNVKTVVAAQSCNCDFADCIIADTLFKELSMAENSQGIMAIMRIPEEHSELCGDYCLFLDRVRDPGNMGTIIRTACAAGYTDIILNDCVDVYNPKVIRSSMTGILGVNFINLPDLERVTANGYTAVAATMGGDDVFAAGFSAKKVCLVIGNEAEGISKNILDACDVKFKIPMRENMESLNAAVSAGIMMYQLKYKKQ